jgi:SnoaL-like domain
VNGPRRQVSTELLSTYFRCIDDGRASAGADVFAEAGELTLLEHTVQGKPAIKHALAQREAMTERITRHVITNVTIESDGDIDRLKTTMLVFRHDGRLDDGELPPAAVTMVVDVTAQVAHQRGKAELAALQLQPVFGSLA